MCARVKEEYYTTNKWNLSDKLPPQLYIYIQKIWSDIWLLKRILRVPNLLQYLGVGTISNRDSSCGVISDNFQLVISYTSSLQPDISLCFFSKNRNLEQLPWICLFITFKYLPTLAKEKKVICWIVFSIIYTLYMECPKDPPVTQSFVCLCKKKIP